MFLPRRLPLASTPVLVLLALACVCFAHLVAEPGSLLVDGARPSIDHANPGEPRGVGNDATFFFLPHHLSVARVIRNFGHLPQWDDRGFGGRPLIGNPQAGMFYPPVWFVWWSGSPALPGWLTVAHLFWGGLGTYMLVRSFRTGRWAATIAAAIYQASPFLLAHTFEGHYPHVWAACWYPWAFWAYNRQRTGRRHGRVLLPLVLALTFLTGHPQEWFLLVLALTAWSIFDARKAWQEHGPRRAAGSLIGWASVLALSIGIAGIEVAPEFAVRPWLARDANAAARSEIPRRYHLWQLNAWQLLTPTALGGPADYFGDDNYWETLFSIGLTPLFLATVGALKYPDRPLVRGWLVLAGVAIWLACGPHLVLYAVAFRTVPGMNWFRVPARSLFLANLAGAVLAGLGVETLQKHISASDQWRKMAHRSGMVFLTLLATLVVILLVFGRDGSSRTGAAVTRVVCDGCFWLTLGVMTAVILRERIARGPQVRRRAATGMGLLALGELGWYGFTLLQVAPAGRFLGDDPVGSALIRLDPDSHRIGRIRIKARDAFYGDLPAAVLGIEKTNITDVFQLGHAARLYEVLYPVASFQRRWRDDPMQSAVDDFRRQVRQAVFDRLSVRYLVSDRFEADPGWPVVARGSAGVRSWVIQRNPSALPRAYVVPSATVRGERARLTLPRFREVDPRETVFMNVDPFGLLPGEARQPFTPAEWVSVDPDHPALAVTTDSPGLLVITDTWMPGWTARVDGEPAPILEGNLAQRVIPLPRPGRHMISLDYSTPGLKAGGALTVLSVMAWGCMCGFRGGRKLLVRESRAQRAGLHLSLAQKGRRPSAEAANTNL